MTFFSYNQDPKYPDRYKRDKGWVKVLPVPNRALQTAEIVEMQSLTQDNIKQGFNTLFKNGTPISGLRIGVISRTSSELLVSISSGKLYVEGFIVDVDSTSLSIATSGTYSIGVLITESIVTEEQDPTLRDPLKGGELYGPEGASRLVWNTSIEVDNPNAFILGKVIDGVVNQKDLNPLYQLETIMARYTYERSGHFCVEGYDVSSLGSSSRGVDDKTKYFNLQNAVSSANLELQQTLSQAQSIKANLDNLNSQLSEAKANATLSPTSNNLAIVSDLQNRVDDAQVSYNSLASLLVSKQTIYNNSIESLDKASGLLIDKELFSIGPGTAYVEGFRVSKSSPSLLPIPKDIPTTSVESAKFVYSGTPSRGLRQISITSGNTFDNVQDANTLFKVELKKLLYQQDSIDVSINIECNEDNTEVDSVPSLLLYLERNINDSSTTIDSSINYSSPNLSLSSLELRTIIKNNVVITRAGASNTSIEVVSTSLNERSNQIEVIISSRERDEFNIDIGPGKLIADIPSANLSGGGTTTTFQLGFRPVAEVVRLVAELQEDMKAIVRGTTPGTSDQLGEDSIFRIARVIQGTTTYVEGTDFRLIDQSKIDWSLSGGIEPLPGTTYYVTFLYTQPLAINDDFILDRRTDSIVFTGRTPAVVYTSNSVYNGSFTVDYTYYLAKAGIITLNKDGDFGCVLSAPSQNPLLPSIPDNLLGITSFIMYADRTAITPLNCRRLTVADQQLLLARVKRNTQNIEVLKLDLEAYRTANSNIGDEPIGLYNEPLQDLSKIDIYSSQWTASVSPGIQSFSAGYTHRDTPLKYMSGGRLSTNEAGSNSLVTLDYVSVPIIKQARATRSRAVSPLPEKIQRRAKMYVSASTIFMNSSYRNLTPCDYLTSITSSLLRDGAQSPYIESIVTSANNLLSSEAERASESIQSGNPINFIDSDLSSFNNYIFNEVKGLEGVQITIFIEDLVPNSDNYKVYLRGQEVTNYTLLNSTPSSLINPGSFKAKADGTATVRFNTPNNLIPGVVTIEVISDKAYAKTRFSLYNNLFNQIAIGAMKSWGSYPITVNSSSLLPVAYADYISEDLLRLGIENIPSSSLGDITTSQVTNAQLYPIRHSSLSQTFEALSDFFISQVKLRLRNAPVNGSMKLYLRDADYEPLKTVLGKASTNTYATSTNSLLETSFTFPRPIPIKASTTYSLGIEVDRPGFEIYTSILGESDLVTGSTLGDQLYLQGSMFKSIDGTLNSEESREDISYEVDRAEFTTVDQVIDLGTYGLAESVSNVCYFCLNIRDVVLKGTNILYEYEETPGAWTRFQANTTVCLPFVKQTIKLRATISTSIKTMSPCLVLEGASVSFYSANTASQVISNIVTYEDPYKDIEVVIRYVKPVEASIKVFYSPTRGYPWEGQEWFELSLVPSSVKLVSGSIQLYEALYKKSEASLNYVMTEPRRYFRYRIEITTTDRSKQAVIKNVMTYVY